MPRKKPKQPLPPVAALPEGAQEWLDQVVTGPMTAGAVEDVMRGIKKALIERALQAELSHHLGYAAGEEKPEASTNQRNGTSGKTVLTDDGPLRIDVPRDRGRPVRTATDRQARMWWRNPAAAMYCTCWLTRRAPT